MNTGLTLRTIRIKNGVAEVRAGATLLDDSDPDDEDDHRGDADLWILEAEAYQQVDQPQIAAATTA